MQNERYTQCQDINLFHAVPAHFFKIHFNIITSSTLRPSQWFCPSGLPPKLVSPPPHHTRHMLHDPLPDIRCAPEIRYNEFSQFRDTHIRDRTNGTLSNRQMLAGSTSTATFITEQDRHTYDIGLHMWPCEHRSDFTAQRHLTLSEVI